MPKNFILTVDIYLKLVERVYVFDGFQRVEVGTSPDSNERITNERMR